MCVCVSFIRIDWLPLLFRFGLKKQALQWPRTIPSACFRAASTACLAFFRAFVLGPRGALDCGLFFLLCALLLVALALAAQVVDVLCV